MRDGRSIEEREAVYALYDFAVSNAWKNTPISLNELGSHEGEPHREGTRRDRATDARQAAYAEYSAYVSNAWRGAGR